MSTEGEDLAKIWTAGTSETWPKLLVGKTECRQLLSEDGRNMITDFLLPESRIELDREMNTLNRAKLLRPEVSKWSFSRDPGYFIGTGRMSPRIRVLCIFSDFFDSCNFPQKLIPLAWMQKPYPPSAPPAAGLVNGFRKLKTPVSNKIRASSCGRELAIRRLLPLIRSHSEPFETQGERACNGGPTSRESIPFVAMKKESGICSSNLCHSFNDLSDDGLNQPFSCGHGQLRSQQSRLLFKTLSISKMYSLNFTAENEFDSPCEMNI